MDIETFILPNAKFSYFIRLIQKNPLHLEHLFHNCLKQVYTTAFQEVPNFRFFVTDQKPVDKQQDNSQQTFSKKFPDRLKALLNKAWLYYLTSPLTLVALKI